MAETEKIIRFSAEDGDLGVKIERLGKQMRDAFSGQGLTDILDEADAKFTKLGDKVKYIKEELGSMSQANKQEYYERLDEIQQGKGNAAFKRTQSKKVTDEYNEQQRGHDKATNAFEKFAEKVQNIENKEPINRMSQQGPFMRAIHDLMSGNISGAFQNSGTGAHHIIERFQQSLDNNSSSIMRGMGLLTGTITAALGGLFLLARAGYKDLRDENATSRAFDVGADFMDTSQLGRVVLDRFEARKKASAIALGRHSGSDIEAEVLRREFLQRSFPLDDASINQFDRYNRVNSLGRNANDVNGMQTVGIITDILIRAERQGILGVSKGDFTALPEKLAQVNNIMAMQYQNGERTDADAAVKIMLAGQAIGGRFADDRLGESMGRIDGSIRNPGSPGMRAFLFQMLSRANPRASYTDILGQMENGASGDNLKAILPTIMQMPQGELRRQVLFQLTKNMQDAIRLDSGGGNRLLEGLAGPMMTDTERASKFGQVQRRADEKTTEFDRSWQTIVNGVTNIGQNTARVADWLLELPPPSTLFKKDGLHKDYYKQNGVVEGSSTGNDANK